MIDELYEQCVKVIPDIMLFICTTLKTIENGPNPKRAEAARYAHTLYHNWVLREGNNILAGMADHYAKSQLEREGTVEQKVKTFLSEGRVALLSVFLIEVSATLMEKKGKPPCSANDATVN